MSYGVNEVRLIGNLGGDPELKYTQGGMAVAKFSVATTSSRKNKDGEKVEETQWHSVVAFQRLGEICGEHLRKGSKVWIAGSIKYRKVTGNDGADRYFTDIVADEMRMLDGKPSGQRQDNTKPAPRPAQAAAEKPDFADDDIPF